MTLVMEGVRLVSSYISHQVMFLLLHQLTASSVVEPLSSPSNTKHFQALPQAFFCRQPAEVVSLLDEPKRTSAPSASRDFANDVESGVANDP